MKNTLILAYDISDNKARRKVFKIMKKWRLNGQKSLHECHLNAHQAEALFVQVGDHLDTKKDCLVMVWLEPHREILCRGIGQNRAKTDLRYIG